jgi:hypothetical protein
LNFGAEDPDVEVCERGRLKFTADALEFFKPEQDGGTSSKRLKGVVLHNILSRVALPEDLEKSVRKACLEGEISEEQHDEVMEILEKAVKDGQARGWFPSDRKCIYNEMSLMDVGGQEYRPDRVLVVDGEVVIIDYKFGEHHKKYERQVKQYASLWGRMGYEKIKAFLWYVQAGEVIEVL